MPYVNSCKSLNIIVMELVNISKDNHCHWWYFYKWTSSVAFILEEYLLFLLGMLTHMWEICQPLIAIMFIFYIKNIDDSWWGTLKKGLPIISWNITIYHFYFCAKFKPSWMIKNVYKNLCSKWHYVSNFDLSWSGNWGNMTISEITIYLGIPKKDFTENFRSKSFILDEL